ncbi:kelch repeat-containing protein [Streptomyces sp. M10(2022)]
MQISQIALGDVRNEVPSEPPYPPTGDQYGGGSRSRARTGRGCTASAPSTITSTRSTSRSTRPRTATGTSWTSLRVQDQYDPRRPPAHRQGAAGRRLRQQPEELRREELPVGAVGPGDQQVQEHPHAQGHVLLGPHATARRQAADSRRHEAVREAQGRCHQGRRPDDRPERGPGQADHAARGHSFHRQGERQDVRLQDPLLVEKATKVFDQETGAFLRNDPGLGRIYVEAQKSGTKYETGTEDNYRISGLSGTDTRNVYGIAQKLALDKKDFQGIKEAFEFDPVAEKYITVDPMNEARWYPTLTTLEDGKVLALSGLDEIGQIVPGKDEIYDPETKEWEYTGIVRKFPTYPAVFLLNDGKLFYSGSNAGYGPRTWAAPRCLGPEDQQVQEDPRAQRPGQAGDLGDRTAASRPGREVHGHRRRRGRRIREVQREVPAGRPPEGQAGVQGRRLALRRHPLPQRLPAARRLAAGHRWLQRLPGTRRIGRPAGPAVRREG